MTVLIPTPGRPSAGGRPARCRKGFSATRRLAAAVALIGVPVSVEAMPRGVDYLTSVSWLDPRSIVGLSVVGGIVIFATTLSIIHVVQRRRWTERERELLASVAAERTARERAALMAGSNGGAVVVWTGRDVPPVVEGDPSALTGAGGRPVVQFGHWLLPADAAHLEALLERLRSRGEGFLATLRTPDRRFVEAEGRAHGGQAVLRLRDVAGLERDVLAARRDLQEAEGALARLRAVVDALALPVWLRDAAGRLTWVNRAYGTLVDATSPDDALGRSLELLDRADRERAARRLTDGEPFRARTAAIADGTRRTLDVVELPLGGGGSGGSATDVTELETARADQQRQMQAHVRTLDQLSTAVAMFDAAQRLVFHNAAYRALWQLDAAYLESHPTDGEILDRLRATRRLPEQADYRAWKEAALAAYRSPAATETWWHLPDRRTLRVVVAPGAGGGLTYLFDDVSDTIHLESRFNSIVSVQRETLDTLAEGVALFATNGRLKLVNRAFADLWRLDRAALDGEPHIEAVVEMCRRLAPDEAAWNELRGAVFGFAEVRERATARMKRLDGSALDCVAEPMPDGGTLITFADVTASVNVERALTERTDALERAARLRNEFVHHVSYELRSPLTNIIGFAELLGTGTVGPLNPRQREYTDHITRSSGVLLAIINDILDLASIDTETIDLQPEKIDIIETVGEAARGIADRLEEAKLHLAIDVPADIGSFTADGKRVRQILYNLLSNASGFSSSGQTVRVSARRVADEVVISVIDQGTGIPDSVRPRVFDRFESHTAGSRHRGAGLGLSIVRSFVELHGGHVELFSEPGRGTTVSCFFPADGKPGHRLAAE